jgi:hypothetical protein
MLNAIHTEISDHDNDSNESNDENRESASSLPVATETDCPIDDTTTAAISSTGAASMPLEGGLAMDQLSPLSECLTNANFTQSGFHIINSHAPSPYPISTNSSEKTSRWRRPWCTYPNGLWTVVIAQCLCFVSNGLYLGGTQSCRLILIRGNLTAIFLNETVPNTTMAEATTRGVGLYGWERQDGEECVFSEQDWYSQEGSYKKVNEGFERATGRYWRIARGFAVASTALGWLLFFWVVIFSCVEFPRLHRNLLGLLLIVVLSTLQLQTLIMTLVLSDFCSEHRCQSGDIQMHNAASGLAVVSGILLILSDNRGRRKRQQQRRPISDEELIRDGLNIAQEIPVESELVDLSLIDPAAATGMTTQEAHR